MPHDRRIRQGETPVRFTQVGAKRFELVPCEGTYHVLPLAAYGENGEPRFAPHVVDVEALLKT